MGPDVIFPNLGFQIERVHKVAFAVPFLNLEIFWYGVFIALAVAAGVIVAAWTAKRLGQHASDYTDFAFYAIIFGIISARLFYVLFRWEVYKDDLIGILAFREGGLMIYGGILAAILTAFIFTRIKKLSFPEFCDTAVLGLIAGQMIGRWGNFFNREAYGGFTNGLFAMRYLIDGEYIQVHPTFLYESMLSLVLFVVLAVYIKRKAFNGEVFALYLVGYGIGRFFIEGLRTDQLFFFGTELPASQVISIGLVAVGVFVLIFGRLRKKPRKKLKEGCV